jgi:transposase
LQAGEQALRRIAGLLGKYDYKDRQTIETRLTEALRKAKAQRYFSYTLQGTAEGQDWALRWQRQEAVISNEQCFDGMALLSSNVLARRLSAGAVMVKYKEQVYVEQTIDFIKSPVQIRPMWLHKPKRLVGLTLLIMIAVLVAALLEHQIRRWIAKTGQKLKGLMPEGRDNPYPTAKALLRAFGDYALVVRSDGHGSEVHPAKLRSIQQQIWDALDLPP